MHLELLLDLTTATFLRCFRRFASRRGTPQLVITDNAKTFKAFAKILTRIFKDAETQSFIAESRIKWKFNLSKAPWWGGFYERLIKSVKLCLKKFIMTARLSFDELHTVIVEIEGVLNSRPLTYQYPNDLSMPISLSHLMMGRQITQLPTNYPSDEENEDYDKGEEQIRKRSLYLSRLLNQYWVRWKREYLVNLREQHRHTKGQGQSTPVREGDIVTIEKENHKNRSNWKLGRVLELNIGKDNIVRGAKVLISND